MFHFRIRAISYPGRLARDILTDIPYTQSKYRKCQFLASTQGFYDDLDLEIFFSHRYRRGAGPK